MSNNIREPMKKDVLMYESEEEDTFAEPAITEKAKKGKPKPSSKANALKAREAKLEYLKAKKVADAERVLQQYKGQLKKSPGPKKLQEQEEEDESSEEIITIKTNKSKKKIKSNSGDSLPNNLGEIEILKKEIEELKSGRLVEKAKPSESVTIPAPEKPAQKVYPGFLFNKREQSDSDQRENEIKKRQKDLEDTIYAMKKNLFSI